MAATDRTSYRPKVESSSATLPRCLADLPSGCAACASRQSESSSEEQMEAFQVCLKSLVNSLRAQVALAAGLTGLLNKAPQDFQAHVSDVVGRLGIEVEHFYGELASPSSLKVEQFYGRSASPSNLKVRREAKNEKSKKDESNLTSLEISGFDAATLKVPAQKIQSPPPFPEVDAIVKQVSSNSVVSEPSSPKSPTAKLMRAKRERESKARQDAGFKSLDENPGVQDDAAFLICPSGAMNPAWIGRSLWDCLVFALVLVDSMFLPVQLSYRHSSHHGNFDVIWLWLLTSFFAADMVLNFFTAFVAEVGDPFERPGVLVTSKWRIALRYLASWFVFDLLATVPWVKVVECIDSELGDMAQLTRTMKVIRVLRVIRMLRLAKLQRIWRKVEQQMGSLELLQSFAILRMVLILVLICHWNACFWWLIGQPKSWLSDMFLSEEQARQYEKLPHWTTIKRITGPDLETWSWLEKDALDVYVCCFYWTLGVMRTMPAEVPPVNQTERIYTMVFMFFAFSAFAICVTTITQAFFKVGERDRGFAEDMSAVRGHLKTIYAPKPLQEAVYGCLRLLFDGRQIQAKESAVLKHLPEPLHERVRLSAFVIYLRKLQLLQNLSDEVLLQVSAIVEIMILLPDDVLCQRGEKAVAAWVLMNGSLHAVNGSNEEPLIVVDQECLDDAKSNSSWQSWNTVIAASCSEVLRVPRKRFLEVAGETPSLANKMMLLSTANQWEHHDWQDQHVAIESEMPLLGGLI